jgi:hypothetical protein
VGINKCPKLMPGGMSRLMPACLVCKEMDGCLDSLLISAKRAYLALSTNNVNTPY